MQKERRYQEPKGYHMEKNLQQPVLVIEEDISFKDHRTRIEAERARLKNMVDAIRQR